MNPTGYPVENMQFQGRNEGYPGQPGGAPMVQYTSVNITSEAPRDHVVWSICSFIYLNPCCLGLAALIFSIKARDRKVAGDMTGARNHGSTARWLNIAAMILVSIMILIFIITLSVVMNQATTMVHYGNNYRG